MSDTERYRQYLSRRLFGSLDGLRAISVLAVIWHHSAPSNVPSWLAHLGGHGVTLFFAISGFLITTLLIRERRMNGAINLRSFYIRRMLRIFPLYYAVLAIYVLLVLVFERGSVVGSAFFKNLPYFLTYTSNIFVPLDGRTIFYFSWSLAAEEQYYLVWLALFALCRSSIAASAVLFVGGFGALIAQYFGVPGAFKIPAAIVFGSLFAILLDRRVSFGVIYAILGKFWSIVPVVCIVLLSVESSLPPAFLHFGLTLVVVLCVVREDHILARFLNIRVLRYLGEVSYGIYLLHMLCKNASERFLKLIGVPADSVWLFVVSATMSVFVARISYRYFESYFLTLKERFSTVR